MLSVSYSLKLPLLSADDLDFYWLFLSIF